VRRDVSSFRHLSRSRRMASSLSICHARAAWRVRFRHFTRSASRARFPQFSFFFSLGGAFALFRDFQASHYVTTFKKLEKIKS
jgi:hypothetical protein